MSDTPPPELVNLLGEHVERVFHLNGRLGSITSSRLAEFVMAKLAEWADGGLIDPSTWTVVEAERETGWCVYKGHGPDCECNAGTRWVLSPRGGDPRE